MANADGKLRRLHGRFRAHAMTLGVWALRPLRALCEMENGKCRWQATEIARTLPRPCNDVGCVGAAPAACSERDNENHPNYDTPASTNYKFGLTLIIRCGNMEEHVVSGISCCL